MMSPYLVMSITMTFLLSVIFGYFFIIQKEKFVGVWSMAWIVSTCRQIVNLLNLDLDVSLAVNEIFIIFSAILFGLGAFYYTNRKPPLWWGMLLVFEIIWSVVSISVNAALIIRIGPIVLLLIYAYLKTGIVLLATEEPEKFLSHKVLGIMFFCAGFMTIFFVILVNFDSIIQSLSPWFYLLNFIFAITMAVSMLDVSYRKQLRKIKDKEYLLAQTQEYERLQTEFFTTISHELKTPLNIILGIIQIQSNSECIKNSSCVKYIRMMRQNCYRLLRLINNLIDINKLESGSLALNQHNYNIVKIVRDITDSIIEYAESAGIKLIFETEVEEKIISIDADKIERVLLNLLSNAIKFTEQGTIEVKIKDEGDFITISVKDTGIGIPDEKKELIFERFEQVDSSLTRKREGSGIGLSLVKSIIELHGGKITLSSELGIGSEFTVALPNQSDDMSIDNQFNINKEFNIERFLVEFSDIY